jgi:hypothetical protein
MLMPLEKRMTEVTYEIPVAEAAEKLGLPLEPGQTASFSYIDGSGHLTVHIAQWEPV